MTGADPTQDRSGPDSGPERIRPRIGVVPLDGLRTGADPTRTRVDPLDGLMTGANPTKDQSGPAGWTQDRVDPPDRAGIGQTHRMDSGPRGTPNVLFSTQDPTDWTERQGQRTPGRCSSRCSGIIRQGN